MKKKTCIFAYHVRLGLGGGAKALADHIRLE